MPHSAVQVARRRQWMEVAALVRAGDPPLVAAEVKPLAPSPACQRGLSAARFVPVVIADVNEAFQCRCK